MLDGPTFVEFVGVVVPSTRIATFPYVLGLDVPSPKLPALSKVALFVPS